MAGDAAPPVTSGDTAEMILSNGLGLLQSGGVVVAILLAMSVFALAVVLAKFLQFRAAGLGDRLAAAEALSLYRAGQVELAQKRALASRHPAAQTLVRVFNGRQRGLSDVVVREEVARYGNQALEALRSWMRPLEVIASLAPLLGLFGTVLGMIAAFRELEAAGNQVNPAILSGGIWEALLTTAVGLAVAIPTVAALNWLERQIERTAHEMEDVVSGAFTQDLSPQQGRGEHERPTGDAVVPRSP